MACTDRVGVRNNLLRGRLALFASFISTGYVLQHFTGFSQVLRRPLETTPHAGNDP